MSVFRREKTFLEIDEDYIQLVQLYGDEVRYNRYFIREKGESIIDVAINSAPNKMNDVTLLLPAERVFIKTMVLPLTAEDKLKNIIKYQLLAKLPYQEKELYYNYQVEKTDNNLLIIVSAVEKEYLKNIYDMCTNTGIKIKRILPTGYLFFLIHRKNKDKKSKLYLDYKKKYLYFNLLAEDQIYIRAGKNIGNIQEELDKVQKYLYQEMGIENKLTFVFNNKEINYHELSAKQLIKKENDNSFWSKFKKVEKDAKLDFKEQLPSVKKKIKNKKIGFIVLLIGLILSINAIFFGMNWQLKERKLQLLEDKLRSSETIVKQVEDVKLEYEKEIKKLNYYYDLIDEFHEGYLPWLEEINRILPAETKIKQMIFKGDKLVLMSGHTKSASKIVSKLEESSYFSNIHFLGSINHQPEGEVFKLAGDLINETK